MDLTNAECGQNNALIQMATHVTQDRALQNVVGAVSTSESRENNSMPPQSFNMINLMHEMHEIESRSIGNLPAPPSNMNDDGAIWATQYQNQLARNEPICDFSQSKHLIPHPRMYLPHQPYRFRLPSQSEEITENFSTEIDELQSEFFGVPIYNDDKYRVVDSLDELEDFGKNLELTQEPSDLCEDYFTIDGKMVLPEECPLSNPKGKIEILENNNLSKQTPLNQTDDEKLSVQQDYIHIETNPLLDIYSPLQVGKKFLADGEQNVAVLCFEAAILRDVTCAEAWKLLGIVLSENVKNRGAITALTQGLQFEPHNLEILMELALNYATLLPKKDFRYETLSMLFTWLANHPEYKDIIPKNFELKDSENLKEVQMMFIKAAQRRPCNPDSQVQEALSVLFYIEGDFTKSLDCLHVAVDLNPENSRLWNRLGAAYSNWQKYDTALAAYHHSLYLDPSFVYPRYNIGMICMNTKNYREGCKHFLAVLNHQASGQTSVTSRSLISGTVWSSLRQCVSHMNRDDLKAAVENKNLLLLNQEFSSNLDVEN